MRRTGHPGSAWFYYELVKRRYPGMKPWTDLAEQRQRELKDRQARTLNPTFWDSIEFTWDKYVLGHEIQVAGNPPTSTEIKNVPERVADPKPDMRVVPADVRPR